MSIKIEIFNTDRVNKYGYKFSAQQLWDTAIENFFEGGPSFINHDYHRPFGWWYTFGLWITPNQIALVGKVFRADNEQEREKLYNNCSVYICNKISDLSDEEIHDFKGKINNELTDKAIFIRRECISVLDDNIAKKILPKIFPSNETDKRALVPLSELKMIGPGVFEIDGFAVFAHSFFRRSQSQLNNLNIFFLTKLYEISQKTGLDVKIALDPNSLGIPETYMRPIELNYWWGPKFNENLNNIPTGVTIHNSNGKRERFFSGISKTEFWWHKQNDIQSLECEEIRDISSFGISKVSENFGCRYVHSMINQSGVPFHLDGAVRVYTEEKMLSRLDVDISKAGKDTEYFKLWRVDGDIKIKEWKELISDFFWDNELVGEYLGG